MQPGERNLTVVFADVCGSTALYETLGDHEAHRVVARWLDCLRSTTIEFHGRVVKLIGDELLCVFDDADAAVSAVSQMQARIEQLRQHDASLPRIRIGLAAGPVLEEDGDVFGDTVNVAARVANLAQASQVLTTLATVGSLTPLIRGNCRALHPVDLKGVAASVPICEVLWNTEATLTMVVDTNAGAQSQPARSLVLTHNGADVRLDDMRRTVRIGRDPGNDVVVPMRSVSRWHARVVLQQGNFVLIDESANGTYVRFEGKPEVHLARDQTLLLGHGEIGLGASTAESGAPTVRFRSR